MRKPLLLLSAFILIILAACSSPEADEVLDYHNNYVDEIVPKVEEIEQLSLQGASSESEEEALAVQVDEIMPILQDITDYFDGQSPEHDITKEYHELRSGWSSHLYEAVDLENQAVQGYLDDSLSEDEFIEMLTESEEKAMQAQEFTMEANDKWEEYKEEFGFEDLEEEEN